MIVSNHMRVHIHLYFNPWFSWGRERLGN